MQSKKMSIFLGFFPDSKSKDEIVTVTESVKEIFQDFGIDVRWSNPKTYHCTLLFVGNKVSPILLVIYKLYLKKFTFKKFTIRFNAVKLGISRKYRELIYLDVLEGGEQMREIYLQLKHLLKNKTDVHFLPHLTLGRVNKDLTQQESINIAKDLVNVSKRTNVNKISFEVQSIDLVKSEDGVYTVQMSITSS